MIEFEKSILSNTGAKIFKTLNEELEKGEKFSLDSQILVALSQLRDFFMSGNRCNTLSNRKAADAAVNLQSKMLDYLSSFKGLAAEEDVRLESMTKDILLKKMEDYSGTKDSIFSVFNEVADYLMMTRENVALVFIATKYERISNLIVSDKQKINFESLMDSVVDFINYMILMAAMVACNEEKNRI